MRNSIFIGTIVVCLMLPGYIVSLLLAQDPEIGAGVVMAFVEELEDEASMNWTTKALRVKGNGFGPNDVELGRRKILAKRAARMDAYRNLVEVVKGVRVTSYTSVEDMMMKSDWVKAKAGGMVKGMRVADVTYSNDGGCEVTVEVNIDKNGKFLLTALNTGKIMVIDNYPKIDWAALKEKYASLLAAFKKKGKELVDANQKLAHMEKQLTAADIRKSELKAQLASAEKELLKTKNIVSDLNYRLTIQGIKLAENIKELEMTKKFLLEKKKELDKLSAKIAEYSDYVMKDRGRLLGYVLSIKKIQRETGERLENFYEKKLGAPNYTGLLVDARELNLKPALAPSILNQNREKIYGIGVIPAEVTSGAIVDYLVGNIERAKKHRKISDCPLVVKGIEVINKSDIMISNEDAQKLLLILDLLEQKKVAILI